MESQETLFTDPGENLRTHPHWLCFETVGGVAFVIPIADKAAFESLLNSSKIRPRVAYAINIAVAPTGGNQVIVHKTAPGIVLGIDAGVLRYAGPEDSLIRLACDAMSPIQRPNGNVPKESAQGNVRPFPAR